MRRDDDDDPDKKRKDREVRELIERIRAGDRLALNLLIARYRPQMERWIGWQRRQQDAAVSTSDIVQEASERVFERLSDFDGQSRGEFEGWLYTTVERMILDEARAMGARKRVGAKVTLSRAEMNGESRLEDKQTPSKDLRAKQDRAWYWQCLSRLPPDQGRAVYLRHNQGCTLAETARELGRDKPAVSSLLWRGLRGLAEQFGEAAQRDATDEAALAPHLDRALGDYCERVDRGVAVDMEAFVAEYPECADALRAVLRLMARIWEDGED